MARYPLPPSVRYPQSLMATWIEHPATPYSPSAMLPLVAAGTRTPTVAPWLLAMHAPVARPKLRYAPPPY